MKNNEIDCLFYIETEYSYSLMLRANQILTWGRKILICFFTYIIATLKVYFFFVICVKL